MNPLRNPPDFSLVLGGPLFQLLRRAHLSDEALMPVRQRVLLARQTGRCFICDEPIDLMLHKGQLDIDHIDPLIEDGLDAENNGQVKRMRLQREGRAA